VTVRNAIEAMTFSVGATISSLVVQEPIDSGLGSAFQFATLFVEPLNPARQHPIGLTAADFSII
jgi:uncharacterized membrane protein